MACIHGHTLCTGVCSWYLLCRPCMSSAWFSQKFHQLNPPSCYALKGPRFSCICGNFVQERSTQLQLCLQNNMQLGLCCSHGSQDSN
jgi:hypothetical protein